MRIDWFPSLEVSSLDLVSRYVSENHGVGLSLAAPGATWPGNVRVLALQQFPAVPFGALWMGKLSPLGEIFINEAGGLARELFGGAASKPRTRTKRAYCFAGFNVRENFNGAVISALLPSFPKAPSNFTFPFKVISESIM